MKNGFIFGVIVIAIGIGLYAYYDNYIRYEREARELLTKGKLIYERGSNSAINDAIIVFSDIISKYPGTPEELEAYFYIAQSYEKQKNNKQAYLKYIYILKNYKNINPTLKNEIMARLARIKTLRNYTDEGIHQLYDSLNNTYDKSSKSRIYSQ